MTKTKWDRAHSEIERLEKFLEELSELTHKHLIAVKDCRIMMYPADHEIDEDCKYVLHPTLQVQDPDLGLQVIGDQSMIEWIEEDETE